MAEALAPRRRMEHHHQHVARDVRRAVERRHEDMRERNALEPRLGPGFFDPKPSPVQPTPAPGGSAGTGGNGNGNGGGNGNGNGNGGAGGAGNDEEDDEPTAAPSKTKKDLLGDVIDSILAPKTTSTTSSRTTMTTPTTTSTSSRTTSSSTRTTSSSSSESLFTPSSTTILYVTSQPTPTLQSATSLPSDTSDGPGAGPIIGIVAGVLAGVAILAALIGFLVKKFRQSKADPYESNPFDDRDEYRRHSAMLPADFDTDDGHPSMSEHHHANLGAGGAYGDPLAMAGAGVVGGVAAGGAMAAHQQQQNGAYNESGGPRPPTMFERHINGPAAQQYGNAPTVGAIFNQGPTPALPPMAFGGGDPYSLAGVGNNSREQALSNSVNPYAHLDRQGSYAAQQQQQQQQYVGLDRNESNGSAYSPEADALAAHGNDVVSPFHNPHDSGYYHAQQQSGQYDTAGRPGTSEGRSGTPDIPNVQQRYALGEEEPAQQLSRQGSDRSDYAPPVPAHEYEIQAAPAYDERVYAASPEPQRAASPFAALQQHQPLQVRNLIPSGQQAQRPISSASSSGDPADIYGGCV